MGRFGEECYIPYLVGVVKSENDPYLVRKAISVLGEIDQKESLRALMSFLDEDFRKTVTNVSYMEFCTLVTRSLRKLTGAHFACNKKQWRWWWKECYKK